MVVVPAMLTSLEANRDLVEQLEIHALGNADPHIHFALTHRLPRCGGRGACRRSGDPRRDGGRDRPELNARHAAEHADRFYLFHRRRRWNASEDVLDGWERKRGKLEEFNRLLRGATNTSFTTRIGDPSILSQVRYCITLDSDTRLPRDARPPPDRDHEHPMNRPRVRRQVAPDHLRVRNLQPRSASPWRAPQARCSRGSMPVTPGSIPMPPSSPTPIRTSSEKAFSGQGALRRRCILGDAHGRVPENALLSHDLFEGLYARTAFVPDVEIVDDFPSSVLAHARRQHRWVRGDWQILAWLLPVVPLRRGFERSRLPFISRWKILDNLRRSLVAPALLAFLISAWTWLPGRPFLWVLAALGVIAFPLYPPLTHLLRGPRLLQPLGVFLDRRSRGVLDRGGADPLAGHSSSLSTPTRWSTPSC